MVEGEKKEVDFFYIGTARAASTWLYRCLKDHPEICVSKKKEAAPEFDVSGALRDAFYYENFSQCDGRCKKGSFPVTLMYDLDRLTQLQHNNPKTKLIVCIRNPINRAVSHLKHDKSRGELNSSVSVEDMVRSKSDIVEYGFYFKYLNQVLKLFPREQVLVIVYAHLKKDPDEALQQIFNFLEVDPDYRPGEIDEVINPNTSSRIRSKFFKHVIDQSFQVKKRLNSRLLDAVVRMLKLDRIISKANMLNEPDPYGLHVQKVEYEIQEHDKALLKNTYREDSERLRNLLQMPLDEWR